MQTKPLPSITIGIPFYNNEKTLAGAIQSVLCQEYTKWELILIDDGSTDGSLGIAQRFALNNSKITLLSDGLNRGLVYRLNQIIDLAQTEFIARMDADDMMLPGKLRKQIEMFRSDDSIDVIDTAVYTMDENDTPVGMRGMADIRTWDKKKILIESFLIHPTVIAKTAWYKKNRYDEAYLRSEDFELWCRTFTHTKFARVYEPLFLYREGNINVSNYVKSNRSHRKMLRKYHKGVLSCTRLYIELLKSHIKSFLYKVFSIFNIQRHLVAKRNIPIGKQVVTEVEAIISEIKGRDI